MMARSRASTHVALGIGRILALSLLLGCTVLNAQEEPAPPPATEAAAPSSEKAHEAPATPTTPKAGLLGQLEELEASWVRLSQEDPPKLAELRSTNDELRELIESDKPKLSKILDRSVALLDEHLDLLETHLEFYGSPSEIDPLLESAERVPSESRELTFGEESPPRLAWTPEADRAVKRLRSMEREFRWDLLLRHGQEVVRLNRLRIRALDALPDTQRFAIYSLTRTGLDHVKLELRMLEISIFGFGKSRFEQATNLPRLTTDLVAAGTFGLVLGRLALVLLGWYLLSRWRTSRSDEHGRVARGAAGRWLRTKGRWAIHLVGLLATRWALGPAADWPGIGLILQGFIIYVAYRVVLDLLVDLLELLGSRADESCIGLFHDRLFASVRWVLRMVALFWLLRWVVTSRIGEAVLYSALNVTRGVALLLTIVMVAIPWRKELEDVYLRLAPVGLIIRWVRENRDSKKGLLALPYLLTWFAAQSIFATLRGFSMRFGQSRRAVAYLFRRRIEKQAGGEGYADVEISDLQADLVAALDEQITMTDCESHGPTTGLDRALEALETWTHDTTGGAFFLAGEVGMGEKAWLDRFAELAPGEPIRLKIDRRLLNERSLRKWLARELLGDADKADSVTRELAEGPRRVVILEHGELLFLTRIDGYRGVDGLANVIDKTSDHIFWVISFGAQAWRHLQASGASLAALGSTHMLEPWSAKEIRRLLEERIAGTPYSLSWSELARRGDMHPLPEEIEEAAVGFTSLLWDYCDGNPRIALHFFLRSLVPIDESQVSVRLFRSPSESRLLELGDSALFLLARLLVHRSLSLAEASATIVTPVRRTKLLTGGLEDLGALQREGRRFAVPIHWQAAAKHLLKRRNLLVS